MYKNNLKVILMPVFLALAIVLGMFLNSLFTKQMSGDGDRMFMPVQGSKLDMVLNMINYSYVDTVNIAEIEEQAIGGLIKDLDPHTVYIPAKDMKRVNEEMVGNFGGIGVQFYKYRDTVTVVKVVPGGPSEKVGLQDGDRIVRVNDSIVAGVKMDDKNVMGMMRGEIGSDVDITVVRRGEPRPIRKTITRGSIPVKSIDVAYMFNDTTGYVKIRTFAMNTHEEFVTAIELLKGKGMKRLMIDLRDNEGGILPIAIQMINEFLDAQKLILYTQGKGSPRSDYYSNGKGRYKDLPITVLINESSASASEIFAGAIQDNDRGTIVGRRSFGKGLVQEQRLLPDGSALRLTVARYYIPSGRSIQRPYDKGKEEYYSDIYNRYLHGELEQKDSIHFDEKLKFQTIGGRTVYGGGGIMPDVFIPADTAGASKYLMDLSRSQKLYEYTFDFMDRHRADMRKMKDHKEVCNYLKRYNLVEEMAVYAAREGVQRDNRGLNDSREIIRVRIEAYIARHVLDDEGFYPVIGTIDNTLIEAAKQHVH